MNTITGENLCWSYAAQNMASNREKDSLWEQYFLKNLILQKTITKGITKNSDSKQKEWAKQILELTASDAAQYIYSCSTRTGPYIAALLYKKKYPKTVWIAEYCDQIWDKCAVDICTHADIIVFSEEKTMLRVISESKLLSSKNSSAKTIFLEEPDIPKEFKLLGLTETCPCQSAQSK